MSELSEFQEKIETAICNHYSDVEAVCGGNLRELGEWIDICKDIAQIEYYSHHESKCGSVSECILKLNTCVTNHLTDMTAAEKANAKTELQAIIAKLG